MNNHFRQSGSAIYNQWFVYCLSGHEGSGALHFTGSAGQESSKGGAIF